MKILGLGLAVEYESGGSRHSYVWLRHTPGWAKPYADIEEEKKSDDHAGGINAFVPLHC